MSANVASVDCRRIKDWASFHDEFAAVFGFPDFYGRNMNAWIDCMTYLDDPGAGMSKVHAAAGGVLTLQLENVATFRNEHPEMYAAIIECSAFVNWRRIEVGDPAILAISFRN